MKIFYLFLRISAVIGTYGPHLMIVIFVTQNNFKNGPGISDRLLGFYQSQSLVKYKETVGNSWTVFKVILDHKYHHNH